MTIVVSNTTESGLRLAQDDIHRHPPESFPGKLLAFLYERYKAFNGREGTGMVIIPTELIPDNGKLLASIVMELARMNGLDEKFMEWLGKENTFCNSLVDRIVTGMPAPGEKEKIENSIGYQDDLMIVSEPYCLWAVEGDEKVKQVLSFVNGAKGIIVEENIDKYRELKLRLLNGTHTLTCGIAFLSHCNTVADAMHDEWLNAYIRNVMNGEIAPAIPYPIPALKKTEFANEVRERFGNPNLQHLWKNITLQYSSKMRFRCIPLLLNYFKIKQQLPKLLVLGFAAYLFYTKPLRQSGKLFYGELDGEAYLIEDDAAGWFLEAWKEPSTENFVKQVLQNTMLWGQDISILPSLQNEVVKYLNAIKKYGMKATLAKELGSAVN
jgi:tagaturonate reductase